MIGGLSQAFYLLAEELDKPIPKIAGLLSYCILTLGLGVSTMYISCDTDLTMLSSELLLGADGSVLWQETSVCGGIASVLCWVHMVVSGKELWQSARFAHRDGICWRFH